MIDLSSFPTLAGILRQGDAIVPQTSPYGMEGSHGDRNRDDGHSSCGAAFDGPGASAPLLCRHVRVLATGSSATTVTGSDGKFSPGGLTSAHLRFEKEAHEPVEFDATPNGEDNVASRSFASSPDRR